MKSMQEQEVDLLTKELRVEFWDNYHQIPVTRVVIVSPLELEEVM